MSQHETAAKPEDEAGDDGRQTVTEGSAGPYEADLMIGDTHLTKLLPIVNRGKSSQETPAWQGKAGWVRGCPLQGPARCGTG